MHADFSEVLTAIALLSPGDTLRLREAAKILLGKTIAGDPIRLVTGATDAARRAACGGDEPRWRKDVPFVNYLIDLMRQGR